MAEEYDIYEIYESLAQEVIKDIRENMSQNVTKYNYNLGDSNLANSLEYRISPLGITILANDYFQYAEWGRGPGGIPGNFEEIIIDWVRERGISVDDERKFARNVAWKTMTKGSYLHRNESERRDFLEGVGEEATETIKDKYQEFLIKHIKFPNPK